MPQEYCTLIGPLFDGDGTVAANIRASSGNKDGINPRVVKVTKAGVAVSTREIKFWTDAAGEIKSYAEDGETVLNGLRILKGSDAWIQAPVSGFAVKGGVRVAIPDADEYEFRLLVPGTGGAASSASQTALNEHAAKLANPDDPGHIGNVGPGLVLEDGVISLGDLDATFATDEDVEAEAAARAAGDASTLASANAYTDAEIGGLGTAALLNVPASGNAAAGEVVKGNDTRLSDSRTPSGGAGGVLSGSYPNPGFAVDMATQAELENAVAAVNLEALTDVDLTSPQSGDFLWHDGSQWVNSPLEAADIPTLTSAKISDFGAAADARINTALGVSVQAFDSDLSAIAGLSPSNDDILQRKAGGWTNRTPAQLKTDLALVKTDVGLGNVDNTSDTGKPVSTAQAAALDLKANLASPALTGTPTAPTAAPGTNTTQLATTAFVGAAVAAVPATAPGGSSGDIQYNNAGAFGGSILKQGANLIEQYNGANAQTLNVYATRTDVSNYERLSLKLFSSDLTIAAENAGTGTARNLRLMAGAAKALYLFANAGVGWEVDPNGHLLMNAGDNSRDIGASTSKRPRTVFAATSVRAPKFETAAGVQWTSGTGSPEGVVTASVGSLYTRTDGGASTTLYVKESGSGNTGWVAK